MSQGLVRNLFPSGRSEPGCIVLSHTFFPRGLDVSGSLYADHTRVLLYGLHGHSNQRFTYEDGRLFAVHSRKIVIANPDNSLEQCSQSRADPERQQWDFTPEGTIQLRGTTLVMTANPPHERLVLREYDPDNEFQLWKVLHGTVDDMKSTLRQQHDDPLPGYLTPECHPELYLTAQTGRASETLLMLPLRDNDDGYQQWYYRESVFINKATGSALDVCGGWAGTKVIHYPPHGGENQQWDYCEDGTIRLLSHPRAITFHKGQVLSKPIDKNDPSQVWFYRRAGRAKSARSCVY